MLKDLNLLVVFEALYLDRNVSRAAGRLGLSQSAVSHALSRLRDAFGDPLFARAPRGVVPSPKALSLYPRVAAVLENARKVFEGDEAFDPGRAAGHFRVATTDYFEQLVLPRLIPALHGAAPGIVFHSLSTQGRLPKEALEQGACDLAIAGFFGDLPEGFYQQKLFEDGFRCVVSRRHPRIRGKLTLEAYLKEDHLLISPQGDLRGVLDRVLARKKKSRRVVAGVGNFLTPGWIVAESELVLTCPARLAAFFSRQLPVTSLELPLDLPSLTVVQVWHERTQGDPLHRWARRLVATASQ